MSVRAFVFAAIIMAAANTSLAQPAEPIGRFVVDLRAASVSLPTAEGWTPQVPDGTEVPSRALALEGGAHVYLVQYGWGALGVGGTWLLGRSKTSAPALDEPPTTPPTAIMPDVTTRVASVAPQVSINFGHALGWSYLSAGYGLTNVRSERTATPGTTGAPAMMLESGWMGTINFGGGARWFLTEHLGVGFDVRWHKLPLLEARPAAGRATLLSAGAGMVLK